MILRPSLFWVQKVLLWLVFFFLPLGTRWIIQQGTVEGAPWEFSTISLYGTDILILAFIASILIVHRRDQPLANRSWPLVASGKLLVALVLWSLLSILWSPNQLIAVYQSFKLLEGVLLFAALRRIQNLGFRIQSFTIAFVFGAFLQSLLGSWQFFNQGIVANKWLGVALHLPQESGAFVVETELRRWLRAYGTFPHPNMLAAFLVVGTFLFIGMLLAYGPRLRDRAFSATSRRAFLGWSLLGSLGFWLPYVVLVSGLFFTFSRAAWIVFFVSISILLIVEVRWSGYKLQATSYKLVLVALAVFLALAIIFREPTQARLTAVGRLEKKSITERLGGYRRAWDLIKRHPVLGTGIGQSTLNPKLPVTSYQLPVTVAVRSLEAATPVHNTPLLVFVELGLIGGLLYLAFLISLLRQVFRAVIPSSTGGSARGGSPEGSRSLNHELLFTNYYLLVTLIALATLALFDHSFFTLHQSQMLFWLVAAMVTLSPQGARATL